MAIGAAAAELRRRLGEEPFEAALVLGSGLGTLASAIEQPVTVPFEEMEGLPRAGVPGHQGRWVAGGLEGRRILIQAGRYHLYEGWPVELVCAPVRLAAALGARTLVVTNAAGGVRRSLAPGALVVLEDHLNLTAKRPLLADFEEGRSTVDMSDAYDDGLQALALACARELGVPLESGVYAGVTGPSYETPAEIRMLERLGADLVGMSTVIEVTAARGLGLRCLGLSLVTNQAAGISPTPLRHDEVIEVGRRSAWTLERLVRRIVRALPR